MRSTKTILAALGLGASVLAFSAVNASAAIMCNGNVCWHAQETYSYPPEAGVIIHDDWRPDPAVVFPEHEGRGYWRGDRWTEW
jgi:hypothetical protein